MKAVIEKVRDNVSKYNLGDGSTMFVHAITVKGEEFQYHSKSDVLEKFKVGEEANFELKDVVTKMGVSKRIVPSQPPRQFGQSNGFSGGGKNQSRKGEFRDPAVLMYNETLMAVMTGLQQSQDVKSKEKIAEYVEYFYQLARKKKGDEV